MIFPLYDGFYLSTDACEAAKCFTGGQFRQASVDECALAMHLVPAIELKTHPLEYQMLAMAIAVGDVFVGHLLAH